MHSPKVLVKTRASTARTPYSAYSACCAPPHVGDPVDGPTRPTESTMTESCPNGLCHRKPTTAAAEPSGKPAAGGLETAVFALG